MKKEEKRNPKARLRDDIGRICPELKSEIEKLQAPPPGPYRPGELYPWLCSMSWTILQIVLHLGKRLLQEALETYAHGIDRAEDGSPTSRPVPCPHCSSKVWHYNGSRPCPKTFRSVFGEVVLRRFVARCSRCQKNFYPLDRVLGISPSVKLFPVLQQLAVFLGTHLPYREAVSVLEMAFGIHLSPETIRKAVLAVGEAVAGRQKNADWEAEIDKLRKALETASGPSSIESGLDGAMVPLNTKPKAQPESHKEARSLSLRLKDATGKLLAKLTISRLTELPAFLMAISSLFDECRETLGITTITLAADGARWIWDFAKKIEILRTVLDWHHLNGYFRALAEAAQHGKSPGRQRRLEAIKEALWKGKVTDALRELARFRCQSGAERKAKTDLVRYVKNNREHIINYEWNWQRNKLVGSGAVEGAQQKCIHDRMRCAGMRWSERGADLTMSARSSELNGTATHDIQAANLAA